MNSEIQLTGHAHDCESPCAHFPLPNNCDEIYMGLVVYGVGVIAAMAQAQDMGAGQAALQIELHSSLRVLNESDEPQNVLEYIKVCRMALDRVEEKVRAMRS